MDRPVSFIKRSYQTDPWGKITIPVFNNCNNWRVAVADKRHSIVATIFFPGVSLGDCTSSVS